VLGQEGNASFEWLLSSDQTNLYRAQLGAVSRRTGGSKKAGSPIRWTINGGPSRGGASKSSDWACAALLHFNRELGMRELAAVEAWLNAMYAVMPAVAPARGGPSLAAASPQPRLLSVGAPGALQQG
jgi:hypothetical protein